MKQKKAGVKGLSEQESRLIEQLRQRPEMMERVQSILAIAANAEGPLKTADEVEELLIQEMRRLGNTTMNQWAVGAEERVSRELKSQDATVLSRKKKR
jgi:phosphoribosyl-dephospho-CoA transferase